METGRGGIVPFTLAYFPGKRISEAGGVGLAKQFKVEAAPAGLAWESALSNDKSLALHSQDKKHPSKTGTFLAACVFYATIYGKSPEGLPGRIGGLTDEKARPLQSLAWKVVRAGAK